MATTITKLLFRRGSDSDRTSTTLSMGEPGWVTVKNRLFVGDGTTAGGRAVPLTDERYFEWGAGSSDESDDFNAVTGFTDDGTEFLTLNKAGLSGFLEQCFVPKVPTSTPNTLRGPVLIDPGKLQIEGDLDVNGSADISENLDLHGYLKVLTGPTDLQSLDVSGDVTLGTDNSNKVTVKGDLIVDGNTVTKNDISTKDTRLYLNTNVTNIGTGIDDDTQTAADSTVTNAGLYILTNTANDEEKCYFRVGGSTANLELKAPTGGKLTLDIGSDSTYKADGNLTVGSGDSKINQDLTTSATGVNFGSITMGDGTIGCGAITSTGAIVGTSLNTQGGAINTGAVTCTTIDSGAITSSGAIQGTIITATNKFAGDLEGNADTASTLETARTIGGVSFDGSANINLPGVNTAGNQDTSGNADTASTLENARTIGGVSFDGSANIVPQTIQVAENNSDADCHPTFVSSAGPGNHPLLIDSSTGTFKYNPFENTLYVGNIESTGDITANEFIGIGTQLDLSNNELVGDALSKTAGGTMTGRIHFQHQNVPMRFEETDQIGNNTGKHWRFVLDGGKVRWDMNTNVTDDDFATYISPLVLDGYQSRVEINSAELYVTDGYGLSLKASSGNISDAGDISFLSYANAQKARIFTNPSTNTNTDQYIDFVAGTGTSPCVRVTQPGALLAKDDVTAFYSFSDRRLKKNIKPIESSLALEKVNSLDAVTFEWRDDDKRGPQIGFIAQDVEEIFPEVVSERNRFHEKSKTGMKEFKHIEYDRLIPMLVGSIKELTAKVEELEAQLR